MIGTLLRPEDLTVVSRGLTVGLVVAFIAFSVVRSSRPKMSKAADVILTEIRKHASKQDEVDDSWEARSEKPGLPLKLVREVWNLLPRLNTST